MSMRRENKKNISVKTIRRVLRKKNYNGRIAGEKPYVNERSLKYRLNFVKEHVLNDISW